MVVRGGPARELRVVGAAPEDALRDGFAASISASRLNGGRSVLSPGAPLDERVGTEEALWRSDGEASPLEIALRKSARSLPQAGHAAVPIGLYRSHWPQTTPISKLIAAARSLPRYQMKVKRLDLSAKPPLPQSR